MRDEALYARDSSMITEFHKRLVVRFIIIFLLVVFIFDNNFIRLH